MKRVEDRLITFSYGSSVQRNWCVSTAALGKLVPREVAAPSAEQTWLIS